MNSENDRKTTVGLEYETPKVKKPLNVWPRLTFLTWLGVLPLLIVAGMAERFIFGQMFIGNLHDLIFAVLFLISIVWVVAGAILAGVCWFKKRPEKKILMLGFLTILLGFGADFFYCRSLMNERLAMRKCPRNLNNVGIAVQLFMHDHPQATTLPTLGDLVMGDYLLPEALICPLTDDVIPAKTREAVDAGQYSHVYLFPGKPVSYLKDPENVLAHDKLGNYKDEPNGMCVLFADGHVDWTSRGIGFLKPKTMPSIMTSGNAGKP